MPATRLAVACLAAALAFLSGCTKEEAPEATAEMAKPAAAVTAAEPSVDPSTGFKMTGDWQLVRGHCTGCHSAKLITQQRGTAQQWLAMIRWMQKKQNLWQFDPDTEARIIAYLAEQYPPQAARRRAAIPLDLMPPNPYTAPTLN
jgi:ABC-type uncharacterized transport system auxiliary subunit